MQRYDEVTACWALGGGFDYILQVVTRDIDDLSRACSTICWTPASVWARYFTYIVTKPVKGPAPPPLSQILGDPT